MTKANDDLLSRFVTDGFSDATADICKTMRELAQLMNRVLPDNPELRAGLKRLLEAKQCFVRSQIEGDDPPVPISRKTLQRLNEAADWLHCLEVAGVDSWPGCEEAAKLHRELKEGQDCE